MQIAEIVVTTTHSRAFMGGGSAVHRVLFNDLAKARAEYDRVAALITDRDKHNGGASRIEIVGDGQIISFLLSDICGVGFADFAKINAEQVGVKDAFPLLFK